MISTLQKDAYLEIGSGSGFSGVSVGCFKKIVIGNNVKVGANVLITDSDWHLDDPRVSEPKPILIEDNVWLGYGVVVMKGVTIGENTIIGINSVVTKDIPANVVAAGNPCRVIRPLVK
jgi:acetyltransferase-like isoleucine patch superfamily enzyme